MIDKNFIEKFRFVDFLQYIKKNKFYFIFLFILLNIFAFTVFNTLEKNFNNKIKYKHQMQLSILSIKDLIKNNYILDRKYSPIIQFNQSIDKFISRFDENYGFDCVSRNIQDDNNLQESKISKSNNHKISVEFKNDTPDEQILNNIIDECNSKYLETFLLNYYDDKLNTFVDDVKFEIDLIKQETKQNLDLLDGINYNEFSRNFLDEIDENTFDDIINKKKFDFFYVNKQKVKYLETYIVDLKNLDMFLNNDIESTFIKINKLNVSEILPRHSPSSYQIFLFFNIILLCIFLFFFILRMKKND